MWTPMQFCCAIRPDEYLLPGTPSPPFPGSALDKGLSGSEFGCVTNNRVRDVYLDPITINGLWGNVEDRFGPITQTNQTGYSNMLELDNHDCGAD
jgi:hypothetical protein